MVKWQNPADEVGLFACLGVCAISKTRTVHFFLYILSVCVKIDTNKSSNIKRKEAGENGKDI